MASRQESSNHKQEIWGIIFLASGLLIIISLTSFYMNPKDNILGPFIGTYLSSGLVYLFGKLPSYLFPGAIIYTGIVLFRGITLSTRNLIFWVLLIIEICVLITIHKLPIIVQGNFGFSNNVIGNSVTFLLHYIFGRHSFGPYFLFIFGLFITLAAMFKINIRNAFTYTLAFIKSSGSFISNTVTPLLRRKDYTEETKVLPTEKVINENKPKEPETQAGDNEQEKDEATQVIEEELAAFRAKKDQPVTISTPDVQQDEPIEEKEEDIEDEPDIEDVAVIDPSLIEAEDDEDEFCKVPQVDEVKKPKKPQKPYVVPSPDILPDPPSITSSIDRELFEQNTRILEKTLLNFGVEGKVINISPGPIVTRYEIELAPGVKISKVVSLQNDISMAVGGKKIRIEAPIPGKVAVGIELPNNEMQIVTFKSILESDAFQKTKAKLPIIIGRSISGVPYVSDITKMPHLLIAGQTGSGKSVAINSFLCSLLMIKKPDELKLILIDPKKVEMSYYNNIPHLLSPVVTESKEAVRALQWGVGEMTRRYRLLAKVHARNIDSFNQKIAEKSIKEGLISEEDNKKLPFIVIIVDELADLMLTASKDVEALVQRIAQLARAVGIHLLVATQRPSVDIITGSIKANLTSRMAFRTIQSVDSRTILGRIGAENLLSNGRYSQSAL
jgi:S-DNA-T family DNA segregation ATPase FtsK/SpoIIIE